MNYLFTTAHPAQIHNLRLLRDALIAKGHNVFWMTTNKDISIYLLKHYNIDYVLLKRPGKSVISKINVLLSNTIKSIKFLRKNKIDIIVSRVSPYLALAGFFTGRKHISLADTESAGIYNKLFVGFTDTLLTAESFKLKIHRRQIRFNANIELFYLHPNHFIPANRSEVTKMLNIGISDKYVIMRFVSWAAYHDKGLTGFTNENKLKAVREFSKYAKVFISSEGDLPENLKQYQIKIPPEKMHDVLAHAELFFGESATMASESAVLGTPAIFLDKIGRGYTDEEEQYYLVKNYKNSENDQQNAIAKGIALLKTPDLSQTMQKNRQEFLKNKIDVTAFMLWFIENYPESKRIMREHPEYQYRFKGKEMKVER